MRLDRICFLQVSSFLEAKLGRQRCACCCSPRYPPPANFPRRTYVSFAFDRNQTLSDPVVTLRPPLRGPLTWIPFKREASLRTSGSELKTDFEEAASWKAKVFWTFNFRLNNVAVVALARLIPSSGSPSRSSRSWLTFGLQVFLLFPLVDSLLSFRQ